MYYLVSILVIIVCFLLILIVLVQNPKGGGLSSTFGGSNQYLGARKTTDFLEKATWTLAIALLVLSLAGSMTIQRGEEVDPNKTILEGMATPDENNYTNLPAVEPVEDEVPKN
ncbi:MAG: preprotein translocase subunit SecG [Bacteroidota bacterium]